MAIQEIEKTHRSSSGIEKSINAGAKGLILEITQSLQYTKPISSTVRELTSNAIDSQHEKQRAIEILTGKAKPEDFFIEREGELYSDSKWDPSYFNLNHLDSNNHVDLIFKENDGVGRCDRFIVKDYGVGIGLTRLKGVLEVGFSTKRNRKDVLGSFGLGAKAGLSTGTEFYTMETIYNGIRYKVKIFNKIVQDCIGKFNETGDNIPYHFYNEEGMITGTVYGEPTSSLNHTAIEVPVLKHYKSDFDLAVKTQLMFFDNVNYYHENIEGEQFLIDFKAEVNYNSDNLIVADNVPFSKPYIVIVNGNADVGVNYGYIDFPELELEQKFGAVGIKCRIRQVYTDNDGNEIEICPGVDVTPNREGVRWSPNTRNYLLERFGSAQNEAEQYVEESLKEPDFLKWIVKCKEITGNSHNDKVLSKLSKIVDLATLRPKFLDTDIRFSRNISQLFPYFSIKRYHSFLNYETKKYEIKDVSVEVLAYCNIEDLYYSENGHYDKMKYLFLADRHDCFYKIKADSRKYIETVERQKGIIANLNSKQIENKIEKAIRNQTLLIQLMQKSEDFKKYDDVEVPQEFIDDIKNEEIVLKKENEKKPVLTAKELRKLNGEIPIHFLAFKKNISYYSNESHFKLQKDEIKITEIDKLEGEVFYGFQKNLNLINYCAYILNGSNTNWRAAIPTYNENIKICIISKHNKKHFKNHKHISEFFGKIENTNNGSEIIMNHNVIKWNTARILHGMLKNIEFLDNYESIDASIYTTWIHLKRYISDFNFDDSKHKDRECFKQYHDDFVKFLDNLTSLQNMLEEETEVSEIKEFIKNSTDFPEDTAATLAVDSKMIKKGEKLLEYAKPLTALFNEMKCLTITNSYISTEAEFAIKEYIKLINNQ
jgi:hypothetical protein